MHAAKLARSISCLARSGARQPKGIEQARNCYIRGGKERKKRKKGKEERRKKERKKKESCRLSLV